MQEVLRFIHVNIRDGEQDIFRDLNFHVCAGEILGLLGIPKDAEFIVQRILMGTLPPQAGKILHAPYPDMPTDTGLWHGIYDILAEDTLIENLSAAENLLVFHSHKKHTFLINHRKVREKGQKMLDDLLPGRIDASNTIAALTRFERSVVAICKALHAGARLLVFDSFIDRFSEAERRQFSDILKILQSRGMAMIIISNNIQILQQMCDRITVIRSGYTIKTLERDEFSRQNIMSCLTTQSDSEELENVDGKMYSRKTPLLRADNICIDHNSLSLQIELYPGEIVGIIDLEYAWSSAVLDQIFRPNSKSNVVVKVENKRIKNNPEDAYNAGISLLEHIAHPDSLLSHQSVIENIIFPSLRNSSYFAGIIRHRFLKNEARAAEQLVGIDRSQELAFAETIELRLRTILARNELQYHKILLIKNPTRWLEHQHAQLVWQYMRRFAARGNAVLFSSTDMTEIKQMSHRCYVIGNGKMREEVLV
ncbi:MAG: hypothetical protein ACOYJC_00040 [Christensenellales bacterium]|jgi:ABC-type sugar transport system ATPase subunit